MIDLSQAYVLSRLTMKQTTNYVAKPVVGAVVGDANSADRKVALIATTEHPAVAAPRSICPWEEDDAWGECFSDAIWSSVELYINGVNVSDSAPGHYPYASYFRNALTKNQQWASGGIIRSASASAGHQSGPLSNKDVGIGEDEFLSVQSEADEGQTDGLPCGLWGGEHHYVFSDKAYGSTGAAASSGGCNLGAAAATPYDSPAIAFLQSKVAPANRDAAAVPTSEDIIQKSAAQDGAPGVNYVGQGDYVSSIYVKWGGRQFPMHPMLAFSIGDSSEAYAAYLAAYTGGHFGGRRRPMVLPAGFRGGREMFCIQLDPAQTKTGTLTGLVIRSLSKWCVLCGGLALILMMHVREHGYQGACGYP